MLLESRVEVSHADDAIRNSQNDEQNSNDSKCRESFSDGLVRVAVIGLVDTDKLEDEVAQSTQVEEDNNNHAGFLLLASKVCRS